MTLIINYYYSINPIEYSLKKTRNVELPNEFIIQKRKGMSIAVFKYRLMYFYRVSM